MHRLMQAFFEAAQDVIRRYDGTIIYVTGEDFTAVFGAPIGQEDHARRAVLAALDLGQHLRAQPLGEAHAPRMGLHTGPVVVGGLTHVPHQPYTAVVDTMHQANQLLRLAPPGTILMSAATHRLVQEEVRGEAYAALAADSPGGPLPVYTGCDIFRQGGGITEADGLEVITTKVRRYPEDAQLRPEDDALLLFQAPRQHGAGPADLSGHFTETIQRLIDGSRRPCVINA
jgi:hypothetical protein